MNIVRHGILKVIRYISNIVEDFSREIVQDAVIIKISTSSEKHGISVTVDYFKIKQALL